MSLSREPNMREWLESLHKEKQKDENQEAQRMDKLITDLRSENDRLKEELKAQKELTRKTSKAAGDYAITANLEVQSLNKRITDQIEELREKARTIDALREDENQEARRMEALIAELKIIIEGQNETLAKHAQETEYRNKITAELIEQRDKLKEQIVEKDKIILNLNEQLAVRKNQIRNREEWFNELETENKKLKADHARQNHIIDQKQRDYGNLHTRYEAQVSEIEELKGRNNNQANTIKEMRDEIQKLQQQLTEKIEKSLEYNNLLRDLSKLRKEHEELLAVEKNQRDTQGYHKTVLEHVKATLAKRDAEVANLRKIVETKDAALTTLREQRNYQQTTLTEMKQTIDRLQKDPNEIVMADRRHYDTVIGGLQRQTDEAVNQRDSLQNELAKLKRTNEALRGDLLGVAPQIAKLRLDRDKLSGRIGALQHSNNELGRNYQITMNRYNKLLERVKKMEMATKLKVPGLGEVVISAGPPRHEPVTFNANQTYVKPHTPEKTAQFAKGYTPVEEPKRGEFVTSQPAPLTYAQLTEWIERLRKTIDMLQLNLEHQTNVRLAKEKELAELRKTVYELQKATSGIEFEYMEPARSGRDFVTYFAFEARSPKDTPTGRRRISF